MFISLPPQKTRISQTFFEILRNLRAKGLLQLLKRTNIKAEKNACLPVGRDVEAIQ
jgi:hypothetical protein